MQPIVGGWLHRIWKRPTPKETGTTAPDWRSSIVDEPKEPSDGLTALLDEVERTALAVYAAHGLPVQKGHYIRSPRAIRWTFVAETLSPEQRWALALAKPANRGWRFARLEHLGADATVPEIVSAAGLLASARRLRSGFPDRDPVLMRADLEEAIQLGADWRLLQQRLDWRSRARLKLAPPGKVGKRKAQG